MRIMLADQFGERWLGGVKMEKSMVGMETGGGWRLVEIGKTGRREQRQVSWCILVYPRKASRIFPVEVEVGDYDDPSPIFVLLSWKA